MIINVHNTCKDFNTYRSARVKSLFNPERGNEFKLTAEFNLPPEWALGLVVGASGTGKTSIGKAFFKSDKIIDLYGGWDHEKPIIDCIDPDGDFDSVTGGSIYWLNSGIDRGDIFLRDWVFINPKYFSIDPKKAARAIWIGDLAPMGVRLFREAITKIKNGVIIKIRQDERYSTFEPGADVKDIYKPDLLMIGGAINGEKTANG